MKYDATKNIITGTATKAGRYTIKVKVTDAAKKSVTKELPLRVLTPNGLDVNAPVLKSTYDAKKLEFKIYDVSKPKVIMQKLPASGELAAERDDERMKDSIEFVDVNFDGFLDALIMVYMGTVNAEFDCWLWDTKLQRLVQN